MSEIHFEKTIESKIVYTGHIINVTFDTVELENGKTATRDVVHHNGGAAVAAIDEDGYIYLIKQYRYPFHEVLIEIPAGKLEKGEDPFLAAKRELLEETGLSAEEYTDLGYIIPTCGYCNEKIYIYGAKGLTMTQQDLDEDEFVSVFKIPFESAVNMCLNNEITDSKTVGAILKLNILKQRGEF